MLGKRFQGTTRVEPKPGGGFPIVPLQRQPGWNGGKRVGGGELAFIQPVDGGHSVASF